MTQVYKTMWSKYHCKIKDNLSIIRIEDEPYQLYNPFDYYSPNDSASLHIQFASIDITDNEAILDFINQFGFLGISIKNRFNDIEKHLGFFSMNVLNYLNEKEPCQNDKYILLNFIKENLKLTVSFDESLSYEAIYEESLEDISSEIKTFNSLLILIEKKNTATPEYLYELISNISSYEKYFSSNLKERTNGNIDLLKSYVTELIINTINKAIEHINPSLILNSDCNSTYKPQWNSKSLISAMYTMLYLDLVQGITIKKCKNTTCTAFFEIYGMDHRKEFCSKKCAQSNASREYRKRIKERKI